LLQHLSGEPLPSLVTTAQLASVLLAVLARRQLAKVEVASLASDPSTLAHGLAAFTAVRPSASFRG
jgi:hypothetical protein